MLDGTECLQDRRSSVEVIVVTAKQKVVDRQTTRALPCVERDITDHVGIICRWLETTGMYFTSGNNTDEQSRAYGYTATLSPQTSMMTSAGYFGAGRCEVWRLCAPCGI